MWSRVCANTHVDDPMRVLAQTRVLLQEEVPPGIAAAALGTLLQWVRKPGLGSVQSGVFVPIQAYVTATLGRPLEREQGEALLAAVRVLTESARWHQARPCMVVCMAVLRAMLGVREVAMACLRLASRVCTLAAAAAGDVGHPSLSPCAAVKVFTAHVDLVVLLPGQYPRDRAMAQAVVKCLGAAASVVVEAAALHTLPPEVSTWMHMSVKANSGAGAGMYGGGAGGAYSHDDLMSEY